MSEAAFAAEGYLVLPGLLQAHECEGIAAQLGGLAGEAGSRDLLRQGWCRELANKLQEHPALAELLPPSHRAVQCNYFDKSAERNWLVALHQDLSLPVAERVDAVGLSGWSRKQGHLFVQAPQTLLEEMTALRLHLDDCGPQDGPLRVVPGSHRQGVFTPEDALSFRDHHGEQDCLVERGGALLMRPLSLHASSKSTGRRRRRVLHFVYGPANPGFGLCWP